MTCYVCNKVIKGEPVYVGKGINRHKRCRPGTAKWLNSPVGRKSPFREFHMAGQGG